MSKEEKKDFNARMNESKNMPKIINLDEEASKKWGGKSMIVAPPIYYNEVIKKIPFGKLLTTKEIRTFIAHSNNVDITCPLTAGIFINICAWASFQRDNDKVPYFRVLKTNGELNPKYPGGVEAQKKQLEEEGHKIITKGKTNVKYYVDNYETKIFNLK